MAWAWRKSGAKIEKNQLPSFSNSSSAASSLSSFSLRRGLRPPSQLPPAWPPSSPPTQILTSGRVATVDPSFSMLQIFFFLLPPTTNDRSQFLHQRHHTSLSPSTTSPSSSIIAAPTDRQRPPFWFLPSPTPAIVAATPTPNSGATISLTTISQPPGPTTHLLASSGPPFLLLPHSFLVPVAIVCRRYFACNGRIINLFFGSGRFWPNPNI